MIHIEISRSAMLAKAPLLQHWAEHNIKSTVSFRETVLSLFFTGCKYR